MVKIFTVMLLLCLGNIAIAQQPYIVKNKYYGIGQNLYYNNFLTNVNGVLFFSASDSINGTGLWKSDGTMAGTKLVKEIFIVGGYLGELANLTNVNGVLYFTNDFDLWKSDGTAAGTVIVKTFPNGPFWNPPSKLIAVGNTLFFKAMNSVYGEELWKSDGTASGTVMVKDIYPGGYSSDIARLAAVDSILYFAANNGINERELWKSDGTTNGTVMVKDINPGTGWSDPDNLINHNGILYFSANNGTNGRELWKSDGTSNGTVMIKDIYPGFASANPEGLSDGGGVFYFVANNSITVKQGIWKSDGTAAGTVLVKDITAPQDLNWEHSPKNLININGLLYFSAYSSVNGRELWKSNGTAASTVFVKKMYPGMSASLMFYQIYSDSLLYFLGYDGISKIELWRSNGTNAGSFIAKDNTNYDSTIFSITEVEDVNGKPFFSVQYINTDGYIYSRQLWSMGNCNLSNTIVATNGKSSYFNKEVQTNPSTKTCYCDVFNNLINTVDAAGTNPVADIPDSKIWIEATQPIQYLKRHYQIMPAANAATATGKITLFATQADFDSFNNQTNAPALLLPSSPADAIGIANLRIEKRSGASTNNTGLPDAYTGNITTIDPADTEIVWNAAALRWEISFDVTGFGGFFIKSQTNPLPIKWLSVTGELNAQKLALIKWQVQEQNVASYQIQRSSDGINFTNIASITGKGDGNNTYVFTALQQYTGTSLYRIKQLDKDGSISFSSIVKLNIPQSSFISIFPNPSKNIVTITAANILLHTSFQLIDINGKVVLSFVINNTSFTINTEKLNSGLYVVRMEDGSLSKLIKY